MVSSFRKSRISITEIVRDFNPSSFAKSEGVYLHDIFFERVPKLYAELDTYWVSHAGADPIAEINKLGKRLDAVHIKDMSKDKEKRNVMPNIGEGCMDITGILKAAQNQNIGWAFVELDTCIGDQLECAKKSRENLKKMGF